ncbi:hypothetical protein SBA4_4590029 [Candidatus Sulfopaludibacter sp. SbA4]|nr:hypothetical protein SBA4_4590029 [Candidatus Sulfopaludibacter sp. SbA4]
MVSVTKFVISVTDHQEIFSQGRGLGMILQTVTPLNTQTLTLTNTGTRQAGGVSTLRR